MRLSRMMAISLCLAAAACRPGIVGVHVILERQARAPRRLPAEQRARLMPYGEPVTQKDAHTLLPTGELTRDAARVAAVRANPDIHAAYARLESARARIAEARALFLPSLSLSHRSTRTFITPASRNRLNLVQQLSQPIPARTTGNSQTFAVTTLLNALRLPLFGARGLKGDQNAFSEHSSAITASWLLFDGFGRDAQLFAARYLFYAATASFEDVERIIIHAVDTAYFQAQFAREQLRIAHADEAFSREQLEETEKLRAAGRATRADVDNFRVRMLTAQANSKAASGLEETAKVVLAELMGLPEVVLPKDLPLSPFSVETDAEMAVPAPEPWIDRATTNRPDLVQFEHLVDSAREELRIARSRFYPTVSLSGSWGYDRASTLRYTADDQSAAAVFEFRWALYTGGARRARLRAADGALAEADARLQRLRLAVVSQVRQAIIDLDDARRQIELQREALATAYENRRIVTAGYGAGKETLNRLNEVQRDVIEADANLALARIRLRQAWTDLHSAASAYREEASDHDPEVSTPGDDEQSHTAANDEGRMTKGE